MRARCQRGLKAPASARPSRPRSSSSPTAGEPLPRTSAPRSVQRARLTPNDTELGRYGLERFDGSHRPAYDALSAVGRQRPGAGDCGDFEAPRITVAVPTAGALFDRSLLIGVSANDELSALGRITLYANGKKIRSFTDGLENDKAVEIDWMGAARCPTAR